MRYFDIQIKSVPQALTYQSKKTIPIGSLVKIPLGQKIVHGVVLKKIKKPPYSCRSIQETLIREAISTPQLSLCQWMSEYYFAPLSKCIALFIPPIIWDQKRQPKYDKNGKLVNPDHEHPSKPYHGESLTNEQEKVLMQITKSITINQKLETRNYFLLHGVTGSGKTEIYLQLIKKNVQEGKQTLLLVPEIALTSELIRHFSGHFPDQISVIHSKISDGARLQSWHRIFEGETKLILGSRSALFTPWRNLGAIIIDEEHEWTYKSEQTPRYHTRTVAEKIVELSAYNSQLSSSPILLFGSATPSVETYYHAISKNKFITTNYKLQTINYHFLSLPFRATSEALPRVTIVDLRQEFQKKNLSMISDILASAITDRLLKKEQVILFLNKRGAASAVICRDCGFTPRCKRCDLAMTYHLKLRGMSGDGMLCHFCGSYEPTPLTCPVCKSLAIRYVGSGTQKLHLQLQSLFPTARILRADKDTASGRHAFERIYQKMWNKETDILVGTQMITKGLDLPNVTLVGIVIADIGLHIPDFRASERVFQLLTQVSGRSGRHKPGEVIIQTYQPEHLTIQAAAKHDYKGFYKQEIHNREQFFYPPFSKMVRLTYAHKDPKKVEDCARRIFLDLQKQTSNQKPETSKLDLSPHYIPRLHGKYIWNILIRGKSPRQVLEGVEFKKGWVINVDPV